MIAGRIGVQVADHGIGRARHHRRVAVGVDGQDRLGRAAPTMCWIAPLMPHAMYRSGAIRVPVWPTCWACGRQPAEVTTRDTPTVPPSSAASSSSCAKPSALPTPRPPPTTTRASASEIAPSSAGTCEVTLTRKSRSVRSGANAWTAAGGSGASGGRLRTRAARPSAGGSDRRAEPPRAGCRPSAGG